MKWNRILKQEPEEPKAHFVDPENKEDEEMEKVEKFLGRFKKPQPMPLEQWMEVLEKNSSSLENLVNLIINLDTKEGTPLDLLWEQKMQGSFNLPRQVKTLKDYGNDANTIVKNLVDEMKQSLAYTDVETAVRRIKTRFSSTLNIRRYAEPLLRQLAQKAQQEMQQQQQQQPPQAQQQQPQGGQ